MSIDSLKKKDDVKEQGDVIYSPTFETDVYKFKIDQAYVDKSKGGAGFMSLSMVAEDGRTMNQQVYFTSGDDKGNRITFDVKKNGKPTGEEQYLPGFIIADDLHMMITEKPLSEMDPTEKLVRAWDPESGKEQPIEKDVLLDFKGAEVKLAIRKLMDFKTVNKDGVYVKTTDIINQNEIVKVFDAETDQTVSEIKAEEDAAFMEKWISNYKGIVVDKTKTKGQSSAPADNAKEAAKTKKKKMFD
jgi:hypothetical protein